MEEETERGVGQGAGWVRSARGWGSGGGEGRGRGEALPAQTQKPPFFSPTL